MGSKFLKSALIIVFSSQLFNSQQFAFPNAQGFGRFASGGRGGSVYHVTNLQDSGEGSFRDAVSKSGRTIVFDVSGVIKIKDKIAAAPDITIAGQTSPKTGITIYGNGVSFGGNTIVRYMRFRGSINMPRGACTVVADDLENIIFDHVSIEWGRWDNLHVKNSKNVTFQYCLIGEGIDPQRFGALLENPTDITVYQCLWTGNQSRNPKAKAKIEYINNVVYNWGKSAFVGGHSATDHFQDIVGNYFIAGPSSTYEFISMFTATDHVFQNDNFVDLNKDGKVNGRLITNEDFIQQKATVLNEPSVMKNSSVSIKKADEAWKTVMKEAGSSFKRDKIDKRIISYFKSLGKKGAIFKTETAAGGQNTVKPHFNKDKDTDLDGIPDRWEKQNSLDFKNPKDASIITNSGYSNLEIYLNKLVK